MRTHREYRAQERYPMEGCGPVAAAAVGLAFIVRRRDEAPGSPPSALVQQEAHDVRMSVLLRREVERQH
jgi:hypothetical protein